MKYPGYEPSKAMSTPFFWLQAKVALVNKGFPDGKAARGGSTWVWFFGDKRQKSALRKKRSTRAWDFPPFSLKRDLTNQKTKSKRQVQISKPDRDAACFYSGDSNDHQLSCHAMGQQKGKRGAQDLGEALWWISFCFDGLPDLGLLKVLFLALLKSI